MARTKTFYGIWTTDDELSGSFKAFCATKRLATKELKKYRDWFSDKPPKPDEKHIRKLEMIISEE